MKQRNVRALLLVMTATVVGVPASAQDVLDLPGVAVTAPTVAAQPSPSPIVAGSPESRNDEKLQPGVIASFGSFQRKTAVNVSGESAPGDKVSPILARVNRTGGESCTAVLTNSSKESSYSVTFDVVGTTENGSVAVRRSYSASIPAEGSISRSVSCRKGLNMAVVLRSGAKS